MNLQVRREEIVVSPAMPRAGETVEFRVPIHNLGSQAVRDLRVDFSIPALNLQQSERADLAAGERIVLVFSLPLTAADLERPLEARVQLDPERRLEPMRRENLEAVVRLGEIMPLAVARPAGPADRARVLLAAGECTSFRFLTAGTGSCEEKGDLEFEVAPDGSQVLLRGEALQAVDAFGFDQVPANLGEQWRNTAVLEPGRIIAVRLQNETVLLRLNGLRRSSAAPAPGAAPPAPYRSVRKQPTHEDHLAGVEDLWATGGVLPLVQVSLEWISRR